MRVGFPCSSITVNRTAEKFSLWSDTTPSTTEILSTASLYWLTQTIGTSIYTYRQLTPPPTLFPVPERSGSIASSKLSERADGSMEKTKGPASLEWYLRKPMGYSWFRWELGPVPVSWARTTGELVWWRRHNQVCVTESPETQDCTAYQLTGGPLCCIRAAGALAQ